MPLRIRNEQTGEFELYHIPTLKGDKGDKGDTGATGPQGPQGIKGDKGDRGEQGVQGPQGVKGDQGERGLTGPQGATGPQGVKGDQGERGERSVYVGENRPTNADVSQLPDVWINPIADEEDVIQIEDILNDLIRRVTALEARN